MAPILNISAYKFVTLPDAAPLRDQALARCQASGLKGTILLAEEGINLFLAGPEPAVRDFLAWLRADPRFADLVPKESWSDAVPFHKMLVKVKNEIIRMNHPTIRPDVEGPAGRAPAVDALTLKRWLDQGHDDEGRDVVTLDTRNGFEVDAGSFEGAIDWRLGKFSEFPDQVLAHKTELQGKTVVSFCTGGIRCEKAVHWMRAEGIARALQLDGGILGYFEAVGGAGYEGRCFVFDERIALDAGLRALADDRVAAA